MTDSARPHDGGGNDSRIREIVDEKIREHDKQLHHVFSDLWSAIREIRETGNRENRESHEIRESAPKNRESLRMRLTPDDLEDDIIWTLLEMGEVYSYMQAALRNPPDVHSVLPWSIDDIHKKLVRQVNALTQENVALMARSELGDRHRIDGALKSGKILGLVRRWRGDYGEPRGPK